LFYIFNYDYIVHTNFANVAASSWRHKLGHA